MASNRLPSPHGKASIFPAIKVASKPRIQEWAILVIRLETIVVVPNPPAIRIITDFGRPTSGLGLQKAESSQRWSPELAWYRWTIEEDGEEEEEEGESIDGSCFEDMDEIEVCGRKNTQWVVVIHEFQWGVSVGRGENKEMVVLQSVLTHRSFSPRKYALLISATWNNNHAILRSMEKIHSGTSSRCMLDWIQPFGWDDHGRTHEGREGTRFGQTSSKVLLFEEEEDLQFSDWLFVLLMNVDFSLMNWNLNRLSLKSPNSLELFDFDLI